MKFRRNLFTRLNLGLIAVFALIVIVYGYVHQRTTQVLENEIRQSNLQKLLLMTGDLDYKVQQMMEFSMILLNDPTVKQFASFPFDRLSYDQMLMRRSIQDKISFQENVSPQWKGEYAVYSTTNRDHIGSKVASYDDEYIRKYLNVMWQVRMQKDGKEREFYRFTTDAVVHPGDPRDASVLVESSFSEANVRNLLDKAVVNGRGSTFLYHPSGEVITHGQADEKLTQAFVSELKALKLGKTFEQTVWINGNPYAVAGVHSTSMNWYMVNFTPLVEVLKPLTAVNRQFYIMLFILFGLTLALSYVLYRNVLAPLKKLIGGLRSVKKGDYSIRLHWTKDIEFSYVFERFNDMTVQIKELIENVLLEQLRAKDAFLKQLQAQINPHFLYNCLGFIINMTEMKKDKAVVSMAHSLSEYYRYMTRTDLDAVTIRDEVELIRHYLDIQQMRFPRLQADIEVPEEMMALPVPRILFQPIVENAIVHGISESLRPAKLHISGGMDDARVWMQFADSGHGMAEEKLNALREALQAQENPAVGYGLWNIVQRLRYSYQDGTSLTVEPAENGGTMVTISWDLTAFDTYWQMKNKGEIKHGTAAYSG